MYKRVCCCSLSFIVAKSSDCVSYIIFIISVCHNLLIVILPTMGLWLNSGEQGIVCAQAKPKWVTIGPVPTPLLRTFWPNTARGSPAQHCKKGPPHYNWRLHWGVGKQIGTEHKVPCEQCHRNLERRETWASCLHKQNLGQQRPTNSNPTRRRMPTKRELNPNCRQESLQTMPMSTLKCYSHCSIRSSKWWKRSVSWKQTRQKRKEANMTQSIRQIKRRHQQEVSRRMRTNTLSLWPK